MKFYQDKETKKVIVVADDESSLLAGISTLVEIHPNTTEAAKEKHIPVIKQDGNDVMVIVGEVMHPMINEHYIGWVILETKQGNQRKMLHAGDEPILHFALAKGDEVVRAISYCNLHGLWSTK